MNPLQEIFIESLEKDKPFMYTAIRTDAIRTVEKFAGTKFTAFAYRLWYWRKPK